MAKLLGICEEITVCDCCGKRNLKLTVALEISGEVVHYGRDCAGAALYGRKDRKNGILAEQRARARAKAEPVIAAVRAALPQGYEDAKDAGNALGRRIFVHGAPVLVLGNPAWRYIEINWSSDFERIPS
jgi:hypothetical protein